MSYFEPDSAGIAALAGSADMALFLGGVAELGANVARDIAPVGDPAEDPHPGKFKESIEAAVGINDRGQLVGRILSTDEDFVPIEFGTEHSPAHATLRRSAEMIGLDLRGGPVQ